MSKKVSKKKGIPKKNSKSGLSQNSVKFGIVLLILLFAAILTGVKTSFFGVAIGILIGFLISNLVKQMNN